jgi:hypothetical protein
VGREAVEVAEVRPIMACVECGVYWDRDREAAKCSDETHTHPQFEMHRHRSRVVLPDGTAVMAVSFDPIDPYTRDEVPDYGLYLDRCWEPPWPCHHVGWPDFGVPDDATELKSALVSLLQRAREGAHVEIGCRGAHGRTGTALACLVVLGGHPADDAVSWVRTNYCAEAVESADQEAFVATFLTYMDETGDNVVERQLDGGIANAGRVVRVGQHVLRPSGPHTTSIHAFLRALRDAGFEGAPTPVGVDEDGRERLVFIEGDVPVTPYPEWSQSDAALASMVQLLRRMHDAAADFDPHGSTWNLALADPAGGTIVCHNDMELSNVVFREGVAVALIDFEFAAPGRPIYDVAQLARFCVPIDDDVEQARLGWRPADRPARLRLVADAYGLDGDGRAALLAAMEDAIDRIEAAVRLAVEAGDANSIALWNRSGGGEKFVRRRRWWSEHLHEFTAALT